MNCSNVIDNLMLEKVVESYGKENDFARIICDHLRMVFGISKSQFRRSCCWNETQYSDWCEYVETVWNSTSIVNCSGNYSFGGNMSNTAAEQSYDILTYILLATFLPVGIIGNVLILYAVLRMRCLPKQTGYFLSSLALADCGVILEFIAFNIYHHNGNPISNRVDQFLFPSLDILFGALSLLQITCISIERAVAVTLPLKYPSLISARRAKLAVFLIWLLSFQLFILALIRIPYESKLYADVIFYMALSLLLVIPMTVVTVSYLFVVISAYQNISQERERLKMLTLLLRSHDIIRETDEMNNSTVKTVWKSSIRWKEIKLSINVAMVVLPFLACWGFFLFAHLYEAMEKYQFTGLPNWLILVLPFSVSCMNPMFYMLFTRSLRKALKAMIKRNARRLSRTELSTTTLNSNSRRASSITVEQNLNRRIGRDLPHAVGTDTIEEEGHLEKIER